MKLHIIAVGKKMPDWVNAGAAVFLKRFPKEYAVQFTEISPQKTSQLTSKAILNSIPQKSWVVALDVQGTEWSTPVLAQKFSQWQQQGTVTFLIGGADGLDEACLASADERWSLSKLTFPHAMVRVILLEQLYRAYTLLINHPYHRE